MELPTEQEINIYNSLDEIDACKHFLNKTLEEAELLFRDSFTYLFDLMEMGPKAFAFYIQAAANFLKSKYANEDSDFVNSLYSAIESHLEDFEFPVNIVIDIADYAISNYSKFDIDHEIYGDVKSKYINLRKFLENKK